MFLRAVPLSASLLTRAQDASQTSTMRSLLTVALLASAAAMVSAQAQVPECPFGPGSCPVELDNIVDVFLYDVKDLISCQAECIRQEQCKFFTMRPEEASPTDHMKCFLFKTCDYKEPCPDCVTGPETPDIEPCLEGHTCPTSLENIVDVHYYSVQDDISCPLQCSDTVACNYWSHFDVTEDPDDPHHKCFLFKNCDHQEICPNCETGPKP